MTLFHALYLVTLFALSAANLANITRTTSLAVPYGVYLHHCSVPGTVALTFDDGPFIYTPALLSLLADHGARSTFFVNGHNLDNNIPVIRRILAEGHQLASHTFGHPRLPLLDYDSIVDQMTLLEDAFYEAIGIVPTYMRPPYLAVNDLTLGVMADLGYHVIGASVDTKDYENDHPDLVGRSVAKFMRELDAGGTIVLAHDIHQQTVETLAHIMVDEVYRRGLQPVTVGQCLGEPEEWWYRTGGHPSCLLGHFVEHLENLMADHES